MAIETSPRPYPAIEAAGGATAQEAATEGAIAEKALIG
jgi:hypothetical protein